MSVFILQRGQNMRQTCKILNVPMYWRMIKKVFKKSKDV
jgi:hypothetical protein